LPCFDELKKESFQWSKGKFCLAKIPMFTV